MIFRLADDENTPVVYHTSLLVAIGGLASDHLCSPALPYPTLSYPTLLSHHHIKQNAKEMSNRSGEDEDVPNRMVIRQSSPKKEYNS